MLLRIPINDLRTNKIKQKQKNQIFVKSHVQYFPYLKQEA